MSAENSYLLTNPRTVLGIIQTARILFVWESLSTTCTPHRSMRTFGGDRIDDVSYSGVPIPGQQEYIKLNEGK